MFLALASAVVLLVARPTPASFRMGLPFVLAGEALRLWSSGYLHKLTELTTAGPFALLRNPMYLGTFMSCVGYMFMCNRAEVWVAGTALFWLFHGGAIAYEEKLLREKFGDQYAAYCSSVPRLIPRMAGLRGCGQFSLRQIAVNNEYYPVAVTCAMLALFALGAYGSHPSPIDWVASVAP
jgi:protein-S-isoprenylcysteine O-methyltransferase Ste14